jgi:hypothetical protein
MKKHISLPPETLKLWNLETLSICLEHSLAVSTEARHQWLLPSARSPSSQSSSSDSAPGVSKPIHFAGPDTSIGNLLVMFELKRYILLHPVGKCELIHLSFPMWGHPVREATAINLDLSPTRFQKCPNYLWNCTGIKFVGIPRRGSWLHSLTICGWLPPCSS